MKGKGCLPLQMQMQTDAGSVAGGAIVASLVQACEGWSELYRTVLGVHPIIAGHGTPLDEPIRCACRQVAVNL